MEALLARLGFDSGTVDGVVDDRTIFAIRGYQIFAALPIDGKASPALLLKLRGVVATLASLKAEPSGEAESVLDRAPQTQAEPEPVPEPEVAAQEPAALPEPTPLVVFAEPTAAAEAQTEPEPVPEPEVAAQEPAALPEPTPLIVFAEPTAAAETQAEPLPASEVAAQEPAPTPEPTPLVVFAEPTAAAETQAESVPTPEVAAQEPAPTPEPTPEVAAAEPAPTAGPEASPPSEVRLAGTRSDEPDPSPAPAEAAAGEENQAKLGSTDADGIEEAKRGFAVQFATMSSAEGAWLEWARLKETLPEILADMPPKITSLDRDDGGVLYRVLTGPLPDRAAATDLCAEALASGQDCFPVSGRLIETGLVEPPDLPPPALTVQVEAQPEPAQPATTAQVEAQPEPAQPATTAQVEAQPEPAQPATTAQVEAQPEPAQPATTAQIEAQPEPAEPAAAVQMAALPGAGRTSFVRAGETFMNGDCQGAVSLYTSALELGGITPKDSATAFNNRGRCHFTQARYDEALADHSAAIELQPEFAAAYFNRGRAYQAMGEPGLAEADLGRAYDLGFRRLGSLGAAKE